MVLVFLGIMNYLIDAYTIFAASVLAANAVLRSVFGAVFPLFTTQMYDRLGIHWASTIPAFLALACVPFPFLFYKYGASIRAKCKYANESDAFMKKMANQMQESSDDDGDDGLEPNMEKDVSDTATAVGTPSESHESYETQERKKSIRREEEEQEAIDYSYAHEEDIVGGRFEQIRTNQPRPAGPAHRTSYEGNPFDLDRVNTRESFKGSSKKGGLSRASSRSSRG